jgi:hypothetical protein
MILSPLIYITKKFNSSKNFKSITKVMAKMRKQFSKTKYSPKKKALQNRVHTQWKRCNSNVSEMNVQPNSMAKSNSIEGVSLTKLSSKSSNPNGLYDKLLTLSRYLKPSLVIACLLRKYSTQEQGQKKLHPLKQTFIHQKN